MTSLQALSLLSKEIIYGMPTISFLYVSPEDKYVAFLGDCKVVSSHAFTDKDILELIEKFKQKRAELKDDFHFDKCVAWMKYNP